MTKSKATAVADVTQGVVVARVDIAVPPERVFRALTTEELTKWWGSAEVYRTTGFTIDLRAGGRWRTDGVGVDGSAFHVEGEVLEVDPPRRLVQTWQPSWATGPATTITYTLDAIEGARASRCGTPASRAPMRATATATAGRACSAGSAATSHPRRAGTWCG